MDPELMADMIRDADLMEDGMIRCGEALRRPVDRSMRERILWGMCKAFYDVILFTVKMEKTPDDSCVKSKVLGDLCKAFYDVIRFILKKDRK